MQEGRPMPRAKSVKIGVAADMVDIFDTLLKSRNMSADVTLNDSGNRIYTFPTGVTHEMVLEVLEKAYAIRQEKE